MSLVLLVSIGVCLFKISTTNNFLQLKNKSEAIEYIHYQVPVVKNPSSPINLSSKNYILIDNDTNMVLLSENPHQQIYPASTTKLATALTALNVYSLDEVITVNEEYKEGKVMELKVGENVTVKSLVTALLVYSANDAAFNLASHYEGGVDEFVKQMNTIAEKYNLKDTHFTNFDGIHNPKHYSSVYDLGQLGRISIKNQIVRETVKNIHATVTDVDKLFTHELISTNELLGVSPEIEGLKTGWTPEAGGCFVGLINLNGHYLISVVAQSEDRFQDTNKLIYWAKNNLYWKDYSAE